MTGYSLPIIALMAAFLAACVTEQSFVSAPPLTPAPVGTVTASTLPPPVQSPPGGSEVQPQQATIAGLAPGNPAGTVGPVPLDLQAIPDASAARTGVVPSQEITVSPDIEFSRNDVLGAWNIASKGDTCPMNLSLTTWTNGFRASTRQCREVALSNVGAWQLAGKQLTLFDASGATIARLFPSGPNRFDGITDSDSAAISVFR